MPCVVVTCMFKGDRFGKCKHIVFTHSKNVEFIKYEFQRSEINYSADQFRYKRKMS